MLTDTIKSTFKDAANKLTCSRKRDFIAKVTEDYFDTALPAAMGYILKAERYARRGARRKTIFHNSRKRCSSAPKG